MKKSRQESALGTRLWPIPLSNGCLGTVLCFLYQYWGVVVQALPSREKIVPSGMSSFVGHKSTAKIVRYVIILFKFDSFRKRRVPGGDQTAVKSNCSPTLTSNPRRGGGQWLQSRNWQSQNAVQILNCGGGVTAVKNLKLNCSHSPTLESEVVLQRQMLYHISQSMKIQVWIQNMLPNRYTIQCPNLRKYEYKKVSWKSNIPQ